MAALALNFSSRSNRKNDRGQHAARLTVQSLSVGVHVSDELAQVLHGQQADHAHRRWLVKVVLILGLERHVPLFLLAEPAHWCGGGERA